MSSTRLGLSSVARPGGNIFREVSRVLQFVLKQQPFCRMRKLSLKTGGKLFADTSLGVFTVGGSLHTNYIDSMKRKDQTNIQNAHFSNRKNLSIKNTFGDCKNFSQNL